MKTAPEWDQKIIRITARIAREYPELDKYLKAMPQRTSFRDEIGVNVNLLKDYADSLDEMLERHQQTHATELVNDRFSDLTSERI